MTQELAVFLIVAAAAVYLVLRFLPRKKRASANACGACETCGGCSRSERVHELPAVDDQHGPGRVRARVGGK